MAGAGAGTGLVKLGASVVAGYLIGSVPVADLVSRRVTAGMTDLREVGSGNPGALNTANSLGVRWGAAVLVGDIVKGTAATVAGRGTAGAAGANLAGTAAVVGHCYPVWTNFSGGKGVATSVGQVLGTFPAYFPIDFSVAAATVAIPGLKRRTFAATAVASVAWVAGATVWWRHRLPNAWGPEPSVALPLAAAGSSAVIVKRFLDARPLT
jgi:glycerol-3-phosphate acyltransferase PlsY